MLDCAVVIVNYRSADLVSRCLATVSTAHPAEVIVVDNASGDGSAAELAGRHPDVTLVERHSNDGFAAGVNAGFAASTAPVVAVLNPDTELRPGALERLVEYLHTAPRAGVAAPRLVYPDGSWQTSAYRRPPGLGTLFLDLCLPVGFIADRFPALDRYRIRSDRWRDGAHAAHVMGAALAIRRSAYAAAGPLDEGFFLYLEETEWQERVIRAGWTVDLVPSAEVLHLVRGGGAESLAPSPHFLASAGRYLALKGYPRPVVEAAMIVAIQLSRLATRAERWVLPHARRTGGARARAYDALWRQWSARK